jgi:biotin/methionine sulfoxide reductase
MAASRTLVNVVYSVQRAQHGEQPVFAALTLAAFLGQIGLPGGGFSHGFGSMGDYGVGYVPVATPFFPQDQNPMSTFIPCARISDMLLRPGASYPYNGGIHRYPEIRLAYWAGGNPFHHHQSLRRLRRALHQLETFIVNETHWTGTAKHADIVFPVASTLERDDFVAGHGDARLRISHTRRRSPRSVSLTCPHTPPGLSPSTGGARRWLCSTTCICCATNPATACTVSRTWDGPASRPRSPGASGSG